MVFLWFSLKISGFRHELWVPCGSRVDHRLWRRPGHCRGCRATFAARFTRPSREDQDPIDLHPSHISGSDIMIIEKKYIIYIHHIYIYVYIYIHICMYIYIYIRPFPFNQDRFRCIRESEMLWQGGLRNMARERSIKKKHKMGCWNEGFIATPGCTWLAPFRFRTAQPCVSPIGCWPTSSHWHDATTFRNISEGSTTRQFES